jgi:hypothetical protein
METWAIVVLVVGTNLGTAVLALLGIKKQLKHSDKRFAKELEAGREADEHNRRWVVRSQPLLELRAELASMAEKFEGMVDMATQIIEGMDIEGDKKVEFLERAVKGWDEYYASGKFYQAVHMQYNFELKREAHWILLDYESAYLGLAPSMAGGEADEKMHEAKREAIDVIQRNTARISEVQSKINELLEGL